MPSSRLIIRLADGVQPGPVIAVEPALGTLVTHRIGEPVVLAWSSVPGLWELCGEAVLEGVHREGESAVLTLAGLETFDPPVSAVTESSAEVDASGRPYALDELDAQTYAATIGRAGRNAHTPLMSAAEPPLPYSPTAADPSERETAPFPRGLDPADPLCAAVRQAYGHRCPVTNLPLPRRNGRREGVVLPLHPAGGEMPKRVSEAVVFTSTVSFYYLEGLFGITNAFHFVFHPVVAPEVVALVRELNPGMRLTLPREPHAWPDSALMRRHRDEHGL